MDDIIRKSTGVFKVVKVAREEPPRYGKHGEHLRDSSSEEGIACRAFRLA